MSSTVRAPYKEFGLGGDYPVEMNYAVRIYTNPPQNEKIPGIGQEGATLKGGQRTNFHGDVPLLDGNKKQIGWAEITKVVSARPEFMSISELNLCGFNNIDEAIDYVQKNHKEEFEKDGVLTIFCFKVKKIDNL